MDCGIEGEPQSRWWENDPVLCSTYSLLALDTAYKWLPGEVGNGAGAPAGGEGDGSGGPKTEGEGK